MASKKTTLKVTINGTVETRTTARTYTHAVAAYIPTKGEWAVVTWCGRLDLAQKQVESRSRKALDNGTAHRVVKVGAELTLETPTLSAPVHTFTTLEGTVFKFWRKGAQTCVVSYDVTRDYASMYDGASSDSVRKQADENAAYREREGEPVKDIRVTVITGEASAHGEDEAKVESESVESVELTTELDHTIEDTDTTITVMNVRRDGRTLGTVRVYAAHGELDLSGTVYVDDRPDLWLDFMAPDEAGLDGAIAETLAWVAERL